MSPFESLVFFWGKILPNFNLKNTISTYRKDFFHGKNDPNSQDSKEINNYSRFL
jgi:hypothetical protein